LRRYALQSDAFELVEVTENGDVNEYCIRPIGQETEFTVTQQEYEDFSLIVDEDAEISVNISLGRRRGFFILQGDTCTLYWFEGSEGFCISGADKDLQYLIAISRSLVPADQ
nr:hypothetical protein [Oscillospiraceae bacterium]